MLDVASPLPIPPVRDNRMLQMQELYPFPMYVLFGGEEGTR